MSERKQAISDFFETLPEKMDIQADRPLGDDLANFFDKLLFVLSIEAYRDLDALDDKQEIFKALALHWTDKHYGMSLLHYAALEGRIDAVRALRSLGFNSNSKDDQGCTPLHYASFSGNSWLMTLLIEQHGLDPDDKDNQDHGLLYWAEEGKAGGDSLNRLKTIAFCKNTKHLTELYQHYLKNKAAVVSALPKEVGAVVIENLIAEYAMPGDYEIELNLLRATTEKYLKKHKINQWFHKAHWVQLLMGASTLLMGTLALVLLPTGTSLALFIFAFVKATLDFIIFIIGCFKVIPLVNRLNPKENFADYDYARLKQTVSTLLEDNKANLQKHHPYDQALLSHGGFTLLIGAITMLITLLLTPISPLIFGIGAGIAANGAIGAGLGAWGLYRKAKEWNELVETNEQVAALT